MNISCDFEAEIPLIAGVLKADVDELLAAAGFSRKVAVATFDQPFPIDALGPEGFERFCHDFLQSVYPEADVHRAGESGHTQEGTDISLLDFRMPRSLVFNASASKRLAPKRFMSLSRSTQSLLQRRFCF